MTLNDGNLQKMRAPFRSLFLLWLLACFLALFSLGDAPLRDFDEATVARVAFEISQKSGLDRLLPTLWNEPYLNKPPGLHWLISTVIQLDLTFNSLLGKAKLPSELSIRIIPALFSTFVVPLGGLIQWHLRPKDSMSAILTSGILLTLLPLARHGRVAMLDGTQLSATALLWFLLVSLDQTKLDKYRYIFGGFTCSFMLLLKAPLLIPAFLSALLPLIFEKKITRTNLTNSKWLLVGLLPGTCWHLWNAYQRGLGAVYLWWGDGIGRVLLESGEGGAIGSDLGFLVPFIEVLEGGWPWIVLWPFGIAWAWRERQNRWGCWALGTQLVMFLSIVPLKIQLPWYSHPLWLPFALISGPPLAWLVEKYEISKPSYKKPLSLVPFLWFLLGLGLIICGALGSLGIVAEIFSYSKIALIVGFGWLIGSIFLLKNTFRQRIIGVLSLILGSYMGLVCLMGSDFWLWELNENWPVKPLAAMVNKYDIKPVFIDGSYHRPSLNWYSLQRIKEHDVNQLENILTNNPTRFLDNEHYRECKLIDSVNEWNLISCD